MTVSNIEAIVNGNAEDLSELHFYISPPKQGISITNSQNVSHTYIQKLKVILYSTRRTTELTQSRKQFGIKFPPEEVSLLWTVF